MIVGLVHRRNYTVTFTCLAQHGDHQDTVLAMDDSSVQQASMRAPAAFKNWPGLPQDRKGGNAHSTSWTHVAFRALGHPSNAGFDNTHCRHFSNIFLDAQPFPEHAHSMQVVDAKCCCWFLTFASWSAGLSQCGYRGVWHRDDNQDR